MLSGIALVLVAISNMLNGFRVTHLANRVRALEERNSDGNKIP